MKHRVLNIVVLGGSRVGKTCLISRLVENDLPSFYQTTPKAVSKKAVTRQDTVYECLITDTASHSTYTPISPQFIIGTHAFILVYDISSRESFELVALIHEKLVEFYHPGSTAPIIVIGNKCDLSDAREVPIDVGLSLARQWRSPFVETTIHSYDAIYRALEVCINHVECQHNTIPPQSTPTSSLTNAYRYFASSLAAAIPSVQWTSVGKQLNSRLAGIKQAARAVSALPSIPPPPAVSTNAVASALSQPVPIQPRPSTPDEECDASATLTASEPVLKGIWSRHQASLKGKSSLAQGSPPRIIPSSVIIHVEDLISDVGRFIDSLEKSLEQIHRPTRRSDSFWSQKIIIADTVEEASVAHSAYFDLARLFLSISEDRVASRSLIRLTGDYAQVVLNTLQLLLDAEIRSVTQGDRAALLQLLLRLAKESGQYPDCLVLPDITSQGDQAVAAGHFGEIWKGVFRRRLVCMKVVKVYQRSDVDKLLKFFAREAILWSHLTHPNLLPFYGMHRLKDRVGRVALISPWMENGCLPDYLIRHPSTNRFALAKDICYGLQHLHVHGIIHGDLKGANILISECGSACLADFGLSSVAESDVTRWSSFASSTAPGGTARWQAPELFNPDTDNVRPTKMSDIYSLGCVMYEIFTGRIPFHEASREPTVIAWVQAGKQPSKPVLEGSALREIGLSDELWETCIEETWSRLPEERPTIPYLVLKLSTLEQTALGSSLPQAARAPLQYLSPAEVRNSFRWNRPVVFRASAKDIQSQASGVFMPRNQSSTSSWLEWFPISL